MPCNSFEKRRNLKSRTNHFLRHDPRLGSIDHRYKSTFQYPFITQILFDIVRIKSGQFVSSSYAVLGSEELVCNSGKSR